MSHIKASAVVLLLAGLQCYATTRNVTCSGNVTTALQAAIDASVDGDTVSLSAGSCTQSVALTITNQNITVQGAGDTNTTLTTTANVTGFNITVTTKSAFRLTAFKHVVGTGFAGSALIAIHNEYGTTWNDGWRIDHITHVGAAGSGTPTIIVFGVTYGLIDHVYFDLTLGYGGVSQAGFMYFTDPTVYSPTISGAYAISLDLDLGTSKAIYIEDCTFTNGGTERYYSVFDQDSGAARVVVRNNTILGSGTIYAHWTRNESVEGVKYEVYRNTMACDPGGTFVRMEAGTGVIWGNTVSSNCSSGILIDERRGEQFETIGTLGTCNGAKAWDGNIEASGWPCLGQVGRGGGLPGAQVSAPLYAWNNGTNAGCATGGACTNTSNIGVIQVGGPVQSTVFLKSTAHTNGDVDFVNGGSTAKPGYSAYTYPHPLQGIVAPAIKGKIKGRKP